MGLWWGCGGVVVGLWWGCGGVGGWLVVDIRWIYGYIFIVGLDVLMSSD